MDDNRITAFQGLQNTSDALRVGPQWLDVAENVHITETGALHGREGYTLQIACDPGTGRSFNTRDYRRAYVADGLQLCALDGLSLTPIAPLSTRDPISWAELNDEVFWTNGLDNGIIKSDHSVLPWRLPVPPTPVLQATGGSLPAGTYRARVAARMPDGRAGPSSETADLVLNGSQGLSITGLVPGSLVYIATADSTVFGLMGVAVSASMSWAGSPNELGREEQGAFLSPLPLGADVIAAWRGRLCAAQYLAGIDQTAVWMSQPFGPALFNLARDFVLVKGRVHMLLPQDAGLVIGTDSALYVYDGSRMAELADYGVLPGPSWGLDDKGRGWFWSARGSFCAALPFDPVTERQISVAPGVRAAGSVVSKGGFNRFIINLHRGGTPFNSHH